MLPASTSTAEQTVRGRHQRVADRQRSRSQKRALEPSCAAQLEPRATWLYLDVGVAPVESVGILADGELHAGSFP